jgi:hypothetical protein
LEASLGKEFMRPYLGKTHSKKGLVEQLQMKALSSSAKRKRKKILKTLSLKGRPSWCESGCPPLQAPGGILFP